MLTENPQKFTKERPNSFDLRSTVDQWTSKLSTLVRGWSVSCEFGRTADGWQAEVSYDDGERRAWIRIDPEKVNVDQISEVVAHELAHILLRSYDRMVHTLLEELSPPSLRELFVKLVENELEQVCSDVASVVVEAWSQGGTPPCTELNGATKPKASAP